MAYKPNFKWTDELVLEFAKLSTLGSYGIFEDTKHIEDKLYKFKLHVDYRKSEDRIKRIFIGKRGMNEDGSRFYYDYRGVKWTLTRIAINPSLDNRTSYQADSEKGEFLRTKFLTDMYRLIDEKADKVLTQNNFEEILK